MTGTTAIGNGRDTSARRRSWVPRTLAAVFLGAGVYAGLALATDAMAHADEAPASTQATQPPADSTAPPPATAEQPPAAAAPANQKSSTTTTTATAVAVQSADPAPAPPTDIKHRLPRTLPLR